MTEEITGKGRFDISSDEIDEFKKRIQESERKSYNGNVRLLNKLLKKGIITPQFADLLRHIHTSTAGYQEGANLRKINIILALRNKLLAEEISGKRIAYIGSGDDWRFAVALGARNVDMVDPLFAQEEYRHKLFDDIKNIDPSASLQKDTPTSEVIFHMCLGGETCES